VHCDVFKVVPILWWESLGTEGGGGLTAGCNLRKTRPVYSTMARREGSEVSDGSTPLTRYDAHGLAGLWGAESLGRRGKGGAGLWGGKRELMNGTGIRHKVRGGKRGKIRALGSGCQTERKMGISGRRGWYLNWGDVVKADRKGRGNEARVGRGKKTELF